MRDFVEVGMSGTSEPSPIRRPPPKRKDVRGCLIEFCTTENSPLGQIGEKYDIGVLRLTTDFGNCLDDKFIDDLIR